MHGWPFSLTFFFVLGAAGAMAMINTNVQSLAAARTAGPPAGKAAVGPWGAAVVRRAAQLIPTPAQWDKEGTGDCPTKATTFSLLCALQKATEDSGTNQPERSDCRFHATKNGQEGS